MGRRYSKTNLFKTLLKMVGDGVVCCEEDGQVLRFLHGKCINIATIENTFSSVCMYVCMCVCTYVCMCVCVLMNRSYICTGRPFRPM